MNEIIEAVKGIFEIMSIAFDWLFTPPRLYLSILVFGPGILAGIFGLIKLIFNRKK